MTEIVQHIEIPFSLLIQIDFLFLHEKHNEAFTLNDYRQHQMMFTMTASEKK